MTPSLAMLLGALSLLLSLSLASASTETSSKPLTVSPAVLVIEVETSANVTCTVADSAVFPLLLNGSAHFRWTLPSGHRLFNGNSFGSVSAISENTNTSILAVANALHNDTGRYECRLVRRSGHVEVNISHVGRAEVEVRVYKLSSYFTEGIIILSVNGVLFLVFMVCSVHQCCSDRKKEESYKKAPNFANPLPPPPPPPPCPRDDQTNLVERGETAMS